MSALEARNGDVRLVYEVVGDAGSPMLAIQGLGYERHGWGPLTALLTAGERRVVVFDNRGVGESDVPAGPYRIAELAADAIAVLDAAGLDRVPVLGASLGGIVAQEIALVHPERVERLVLGCTTPGGSAFPMPDRTIQVFATFATLPREQALRLGVENALADEVVAARPELVEEIYAYRLAHAPGLAGWQAQASAAFGFNALDRLAQLRMPTLVLHGTADNVVDFRNSELIAAQVPGARLELFPGAGHLFFWEEPEATARAILDFLASEVVSA